MSARPRYEGVRAGEFLRLLRAAVLAHPADTDEEIIDRCVEQMEEQEHEWRRERAERGIPEDTWCITDGVDNCNDAGTGEGQFHGRI